MSDWKDKALVASLAGNAVFVSLIIWDHVECDPFLCGLYDKEWTVSEVILEEGADKEEHVVEGDSFIIKRIQGVPHILPDENLASRWGLTAGVEHELDQIKGVFCLEVDLHHAKTNSTESHWITFRLSPYYGIPNFHKATSYVSHKKSGMTCGGIDTHGGTFHAED